MVTLLVVLSLVAAVLGFLQLSQATVGVGFIAGGILLAVYARLAQAEAMHDALHPKPKLPAMHPEDARDLARRAVAATQHIETPAPQTQATASVDNVQRVAMPISKAGR